MKYYIDNSIDDVYDKPYKDTYAEALEVKSGNVAGYRTKTVISGDVLESEIYPFWLTKADVQTVNKQLKKRTYEEQRKAYEKQQRKYLTRVINKNFRAGESWVTLTYDDEHLPPTFEDAERSILNYIRRVKYHAKKKNIDVKYVYTIEVINKDEQVVRVHHHVIINLTDRDFIEAAWKYGGRPHARSLKPDDDGLDGMANYILRPSKNKKAYRCSLNLAKPTMTTADTKVTRRSAVHMANNYDFAVAKLTKLYPDYIFKKLEINTSDNLSGFYIYAKFIKREPSPPAEPIYILHDFGHQKNNPRELNTPRTRRKPSPRMPKPLTKTQIKDRLKKLAGIDKEITKLYRDLTALPKDSPMYKSLEKTLNARNNELQWFNTVTACITPQDKALLEDRYIRNKRSIELAFKYYTGGGESGLSHKISRLIAEMVKSQNDKTKTKI